MSNTESKYLISKKKPGKTKAFFICLLIASFLWLVHSLNTVYTQSFKIPVVFKNLPPGKRPLVQIPEVLTIDVKGSGLKLAMMLLTKSKQALEIDFNALKSHNRNQTFILSSSRINFKPVLGFEALVKHIYPDTLYFTEKTGYQKNVALKVPLYLKCREGYAYKKPEINPSFITIFGDTADIAGIDTIYTQAINLNDVSENINMKPLLVKPKPEVYTNVSEASVFIEVEKLIEQVITLPISDIRQNNARHINIFPSQVKVKFTTIQNSFNVQDTALFKAMINSDKINSASKKCEVFLSTVPGHVTVMDIEPRQVEILILKNK